MTNQIPKTFSIFYNSKNKRAVVWASKIMNFVSKNYPEMKKNSNNPDAVIVLGGDGTILEAARKYHERGSVILGLNLGTVGFLASVRKEKDFLPLLKNFFGGKYHIVERMMITSEVKRNKKTVFTGDALNEIAVKSLLGIVELQARIESHPVQDIRGTGILVSTATGSTAYNLSAHGPIIMPDIKCLIVTELLDHSIPTPSIVVKYNNKVTIRVINFKKRGFLSFSATGEKVDVLLSVDGESMFPLEPGDEINVQSSPHLIRFAELEKNYFFKSLEEKFGFR